MARRGLSYSFSEEGRGFVEQSSGERGGEESVREDRERVIRRW